MTDKVEYFSIKRENDIKELSANWFEDWFFGNIFTVWEMTLDLDKIGKNERITSEKQKTFKNWQSAKRYFNKRKKELINGTH